ncbi:hypothetical protein RRG08_031170 [Elysia crispata]|uniref:Uncharacterized protein n=1 Tax=Elysia crispata TaxID=231223 RepID=A0AAE0ZFI1_9GAST|nr:hypothetical protein RRG08_031170 [Elysia crispata]
MAICRGEVGGQCLCEGVYVGWVGAGAGRVLGLQERCLNGGKNSGKRNRGWHIQPRGEQKNPQKTGVDDAARMIFSPNISSPTERSPETCTNRRVDKI